jgi:hypothetical protein
MSHRFNFAGGEAFQGKMQENRRYFTKDKTRYSQPILFYQTEL